MKNTLGIGVFSHRTTSRSSLSLLAALVSAALLFVPSLRADDAAPGARAARLSSVDGQVQLVQGKQILVDQAVANTPLFEGTSVITGDDGRAEIQFEDGSVARLSPGSSLTFPVLRGSGANGEADIRLDSGLGYFELQSGSESGQLKVTFGDSSISASGFTVLRLNLDTPPGELAVFSGNAHLERGSALTMDLHGGETATLSGSDLTRYKISETIEPDSWDSWNSDRDQVLTAEAAAKTGATKDYSNNTNPAWNDLDANGNWYNVPGQGRIWSPYDAANPGWDPYGNGNWMYQPTYGYTWISANPWGYLPYQCGAWNYYDSFGWGWAPGVGGCNPWWRSGFGRGGYGGGYYAPNIGVAYGGYRAPVAPRPPRRPTHFGGTLIGVNRLPQGNKAPTPIRDRTGVVTIAGNAVMPFRSLNARPQYNHSASGFVNHAEVPFSGVRPASGAIRPSGPTFGANRGGNPNGNFNGSFNSGFRNSMGMQHGSINGAPSSNHVSGGVQSHATGSFGGGGGGASHSSGGGFSGGGGGGGGSHPSAGGGGGGGGGGASHH